MSEKNKSMKILKCFKMCVVYCKKCLQFFDFDNKVFVMWFLLYDDKYVVDSKGILFLYKF